MANSLRTVNEHELALFVERIGRSLAERPLDIDVTEHRERVAALLREVGGVSFYQLLGVGAAATPEKVHEAYEQLARMVHPSHAPYLGLRGMEDVLTMLFERATAAYITLSHPGRRRDYDRELGPAGWDPIASAQNRAEQNRDRARAHFNRAAQYAAKDEFHFAIELLREAVRIDPQAKYFARLGELQERNQRWLHQAADSYTRALELGGPDPTIENALARVQRRLTHRGTAEPDADSTSARTGAASAGSGSAHRGDPGALPDAAGSAPASGSPSKRFPADGVWEAEEAGADPGDDTQVDRWLHRGP